MSVDEDARRLVETCLAAYYERHYPLPGVPADMRVDEPNGDGWCDWKMIPSPADEKDVAALEARLPCRLPPVLRAYLTTSCVLGMDFGNFHLPEVPSHDPLRPMTGRLMGMDRKPELWAAGYVEVASTADGDPVCLDLRRPTGDGDFAIVTFNHDFVPRDAWNARDTLEPYAGFVARSFRRFFGDLCMERPIEVQASALERAHNEPWGRVHEALRARGMLLSAVPEKVRAGGPATALAFVEKAFPKRGG
jgi:hypothetical protein